MIFLQRLLLLWIAGPVNSIHIFHFRSSAEVKSNCDYPDYSLVARIGYCQQHGRVHSCSSGYRSRDDFAAYCTRSAGIVTLARLALCCKCAGKIRRLFTVSFAVFFLPVNCLLMV